uniref:Uncharacterized protein n=1 Tax=Mesocestoides corti TaxID=53468 RepID=A0A5K3FKK8_MESCO
MPLDRRETRDWLWPGGPTCLRPDPSPHFYYYSRVLQYDNWLITVVAQCHDFNVSFVICILKEK